MVVNNHTMTNTESGNITYFIDIVISNTLYSIDILTYPVPTSLPSGSLLQLYFEVLLKTQF